MEWSGYSFDEGTIDYDTSRLQPQPSTSSLSRQFTKKAHQTITVDPSASINDTPEENIYETIEELGQQQPQVMNHPPHAPPMEEPIYLDQPSCSSTYGRIGKFNLANVEFNIMSKLFSVY